MKIVKKLLSGGGLPPFVSYEPVVVNNAASAVDGGTAASATKGKGSSDDTKGLITDKDLLTMLKDIDGLPSDMQALYRLLTIFYRTGGAASPLNTGSLSTQYLRSIQAIKNAKYNKEVFEKAYENLNKNGGLNEFAIDSTGKIIVKNAKGEIDSVSFDKLKELKDYAPMTNAELLQYRAEAPQYANANTLSAIASNGIGLEQVNKLIRANLMDLGTLSKTMEGTLSGKEAQGLQILQQLMLESKLTAGTDLEGLYKAKVVTKELVSKINSVLQYAYNMLPENAKTLLKLKTGSAENSYKMIYEMLVGTADSTNDISLEYLADKEGYKPTSSKSKEEADKEGKTDIFTNIVLNLGGTNTTFSLQDSSGRTMQISGTGYGNLQLDPSKPLKEGTLQSLMDYGYGSIVKGGNYAITFGDKVVDNSAMEKITFVNDLNATRTMLPVKIDPDTGKTVPDLEFMESHKDLIKKINSKGLNNAEVQQELINAGLVNLFTGQPEMSKFQSYLCVDGLGTSQDLPLDGFYTEIKGDKLDLYLLKFKNSTYKSKEKNGGKEYKFDFDEDSWWLWDWFGNYDRLYKGTIFIPLTENPVASKTGAGNNPSVQQQTNLEQMYLIGDAARNLNMQTTSSSVL